MITIDLKAGTVQQQHEDGRTEQHALASPEGFKVVSDVWLRAGWDNKYVYTFTWLGRPVVQLPDDLLRMQEVVYRVQPDVIIETGVAHGGSLMFYATLCKVLGRGRVVGIDINIRAHNRAAIEKHPLFPCITLIEGSSVAPETVARVVREVQPGEKVLVVLDSCHSKEHVLGELEAYAPLVGADSYIVAMDGIMQDVVGAPRTQPDWGWNNPRQAVLEFVRLHPEFVIDEPGFLFNESPLSQRVTYSPLAFIRPREARAVSDPQTGHSGHDPRQQDRLPA
jgi:cephalosporin hydroxylase